MPYVEVKGRVAVLMAASSALMAAVPLSLAVVLLNYKRLTVVDLAPGVKIPWASDVYMLFSLSLAAAVLPYVVVNFMNRRYVEAIEKSLPAFFEGLEEGVRAGMPLIKALETASKSLGGPLANEMLTVVSRVELGDTLDNALSGLVKRIPAPALRRAASLVLVAYQSGGRVGEVLGAAAEMYSMLRSYEEERRATMSPYAITVYVALIIFLLISSILLLVFIIPLEALGGEARQILTPLPSPLFKATFFIASAVQAVAGGLVAGKMSRGTVKAGLIHAVVMLVTVALYFYILEAFVEPMVIHQG